MNTKHIQGKFHISQVEITLIVMMFLGQDIIMGKKRLIVQIMKSLFIQKEV